MGAERK